jgi:beta-glucosidase
MITGRPLYVNPALNLADAFVVAWLPGTEGGGLADVLIGDKGGIPRFDFTGKLPTAWPRTALMRDGALYPFGYGLSYASPIKAWSALPEDAGVASVGDTRLWFANGIPAPSWSMRVVDPANGTQTRLTTVPASLLDNRLTVTATDFRVQEGARRFALSSGAATIALDTFEPIDIARETNGDVMLLLTAQVGKAPASATIAMNCAGAACGGGFPLALPASKGFVRYGISLKCFAARGVDMARIGAPFVLTTQGPADIAIGEVRLGTDAEVVLPCT